MYSGEWTSYERSEASNESNSSAKTNNDEDYAKKVGYLLIEY